ncbi:hypothetical protein HYY71_03865 [Candidatus Woesearchaeota archaeon]|nr:hypothetical protein [Candidatus Woesearchaeota archaeon]
MFIKHIKKDVNKVLLFLIIAPLILFAWFSTYYDNKLNNITIGYDKSREKLQELTGKVVLEKFNETVQQKESFQKDKESLEKRYYDLKTENEELKTGKDKLHAELNSVKSELESQKANFNALQSQFQQVQNSLIAANEQISGLIARINELCSKLKNTGGSNEKC